MNQRFLALWGLATAAISTVVGLIAYHAGQTSQIVTATGADGRAYPGYYGFGFFPFFGLFWILLLGFLFFRFVVGRPWRGYWGPGGGGYWHQHPQGPGEPTNQPSTGTSQTSASA